MPTKDKSFQTKSEFIADLAVLLAGYVTEKETFNELSTGASNDLKEATKLARRMIMEFGMSEVMGPRTFGKREDMIFLGREITEQRDYSEKVAEMIDKEISKFIENAQATALELIRKKKNKLEEIVASLMAKETIERDEFKAIFDETKTVKKEPETKTQEKNA